jgi:hypothetical protein
MEDNFCWAISSSFPSNNKSNLSTSSPFNIFSSSRECLYLSDSTNNSIKLIFFILYLYSIHNLKNLNRLLDEKNTLSLVEDIKVIKDLINSFL